MNKVYSNNGEEYHDEFEYVLDGIRAYNCETFEEALEAIVYVGEPVSPKIKKEWLVEHITEYICERVYEQVGEYADDHVVQNKEELDKFLETWLDKQVYSCYTVKNVKQVSILEYMTKEELKEIYE